MEKDEAWRGLTAWEESQDYDQQSLNMALMPENPHLYPPLLLEMGKSIPPACAKPPAAQKWVFTVG
jgi:hypothetical protein